MKAKSDSFSGYILAGGQSSRMGRDKAFLKINGKTFLQNAVDNLKPVCKDNIKIILKDESLKVSLEYSGVTSCLYDIYKNRGVLAGIHASLKDCKKEFAVILACDMPLVTDQTIQMLAEKAMSGKYDAVVPNQYDDRLQPLCATYRVQKCLGTLEEMLESENSGSARKFLTKLHILTIDQSEFKCAKDIFLNVNYVEDYDNISMLKV